MAVQRQTREQARLRDFRMLQPGEVDREIDTALLRVPPSPLWDAATVAACAAIYDRYVRPKTGLAIPERAFCDLPRWVFLEYAIRFAGTLLMGDNDPRQTHLRPVVLSQNVSGWNRPRLYAFASSTEAIFHAILDNDRLKVLDCATRSTVSLPLTDRSGGGGPVYGFYFGLDYRSLPQAPWRSGAVYLYDRAAFPEDFATVPFLTETPILPLAKLTVYPWDWPLLDQVCGVNVVAQTERQRETFIGYPWTDDPTIHPYHDRRSLTAQIRSYLDTHIADPADLVTLGRRFGISPFALLRQFRAQTGLSPYEYHLLLRICRAKQRLAAGLPIAQVAVETGFCDQTHLTRHFRALVGLTPGQYIRVQ